jgi:hypothetical protein
MILTIMIIPPISFAVTFALIGPRFPFHDRGTAPNSVGPNFNPVFGIARMDSISNLDCMVRNRNMTVVCAFEMDQKI